MRTALGAGIECEILNAFSWKRKESIKNTCEGESSIKYCQLFKMIEKWIQIGFSFVLKLEDNFDEALNPIFIKFIFLKNYLMKT